MKNKGCSEMNELSFLALRQIEWVNGDSGNLIPDVRR